MYKKLFEVDVIGCEDTRIAGQLYKLMDNKKVGAKLYDCFGYGSSELVKYD
jgi:16S rRNA C1402 (ribose-2'-O) methylase RsmI